MPSLISFFPEFLYSFKCGLFEMMLLGGVIFTFSLRDLFSRSFVTSCERALTTEKGLTKLFLLSSKGFFLEILGGCFQVEILADRLFSGNTVIVSTFKTHTSLDWGLNCLYKGKGIYWWRFEKVARIRRSFDIF